MDHASSCTLVLSSVSPSLAIAYDICMCMFGLVSACVCAHWSPLALLRAISAFWCFLASFITVTSATCHPSDPVSFPPCCWVNLLRLMPQTHTINFLPASSLPSPFLASYCMLPCLSSHPNPLRLLVFTQAHCILHAGSLGWLLTCYLCEDLSLVLLLTAGAG